MHTPFHFCFFSPWRSGCDHVSAPSPPPPCSHLLLLGHLQGAGPWGFPAFPSWALLGSPWAKPAACSTWRWWPSLLPPLSNVATECLWGEDTSPYASCLMMAFEMIQDALSWFHATTHQVCCDALQSKQGQGAALRVCWQERRCPTCLWGLESRGHFPSGHNHRGVFVVISPSPFSCAPSAWGCGRRGGPGGPVVFCGWAWRWMLPGLFHHWSQADSACSSSPSPALPWEMCGQGIWICSAVSLATRWHWCEGGGTSAVQSSSCDCCSAAVVFVVSNKTFSLLWSHLNAYRHTLPFCPQLPVPRSLVGT